jgi:hypothetical protein
LLSVPALAATGLLTACAPATTERPAQSAPRIIEAQFVGPARWEHDRQKYVTDLSVRFEPTNSPLFRDIAIHWKNRNGEGVQHESANVSEFARGGRFTLGRLFKFPGEYTFTITLRNDEGESSVTLPPLIVGRWQ